jgi:hypothetical protein
LKKIRGKKEITQENINVLKKKKEERTKGKDKWEQGEHTVHCEEERHNPNVFTVRLITFNSLIF